MRLTTDGIKENLDWFDRLPSSQTQHPDVIASDTDARESDTTLYAYSDSTTAMEVQYAMATAGYTPNAIEMDDLQERFPLLYGAPAVAEVVEFNDQIAA